MSDKNINLSVLRLQFATDILGCSHWDEVAEVVYEMESLLRLSEDEESLLAFGFLMRVADQQKQYIQALEDMVRAEEKYGVEIYLNQDYLDLNITYRAIELIVWAYGFSTQALFPDIFFALQDDVDGSHQFQLATGIILAAQNDWFLDLNSLFQIELVGDEFCISCVDNAEGGVDSV